MILVISFINIPRGDKIPPNNNIQPIIEDGRHGKSIKYFNRFSTLIHKLFKDI